MDPAVGQIIIAGGVVVGMFLALSLMRKTKPRQGTPAPPPTTDQTEIDP